MEKGNKSIFTRKYFLDGLLIVFSVLFALFINKVAENMQVANDKEIAMENIEMELQRNAAVLEKWHALHSEVLNRINVIVEGENDSLRKALLNYDYLHIGILTNDKPIISANISNTAWETAKSTGIISEFDFNTTQKLTEVYLLQDIIVEKTLMKIIDLLFDPTTHDMNNIEPTLIQLQLRFKELVGQEILLTEVYGQVLSDPEISVD